MTDGLISLTSDSRPSKSVTSSLRIRGGEERERPVPIAVQPFSSKDLRTALPSRPEAPVTRTVLLGVDMAQVGDFDDRRISIRNFNLRG